MWLSYEVLWRKDFKRPQQCNIQVTGGFLPPVCYSVYTKWSTVLQVMFNFYTVSAVKQRIMNHLHIRLRDKKLCTTRMTYFPSKGTFFRYQAATNYSYSTAYIRFSLQFTTSYCRGHNETPGFSFLWFIFDRSRLLLIVLTACFEPKIDSRV